MLQLDTRIRTARHGVWPFAVCLTSWCRLHSLSVCAMTRLLLLLNTCSRHLYASLFGKASNDAPAITAVTSQIEQGGC